MIRQYIMNYTYYKMGRTVYRVCDYPQAKNYTEARYKNKWCCCNGLTKEVLASRKLTEDELMLEMI